MFSFKIETNFAICKECFYNIQKRSSLKWGGVLTNKHKQSLYNTGTWKFPDAKNMLLNMLLSANCLAMNVMS